MEKEVEVVEIDDKNYIVIKEATKDDKTFLYLSNINDEEDTLIRKLDIDDKNKVLPLENDEEFELACNLFIKEYTN